MVHTFQTLEAGVRAPLPALAAARAVNALPMLTWVPKHGLEPILQGDLDAEIRAWAQAVGELNHPILFRFAQEMNLTALKWFGPADRFVAAWRRVHDLFDESDARNLIWVWCPYVHERGTARFEPYYPGDDVVDVLGLDGYNWGRRRWWHRWHSFDAIFGDSYAALRQLAPSRPIILAEIGCAERGGDKAAWMREALLQAIPDRYPGIEAVVWFDHHRPENPDWRIESSAAVLAAWREIVADPRYRLSADDLMDRLSRPRH